MRAVTKNYTFSVKRPKNGWGVSSLNEIKKIASEITRKHNSNFKKEYRRVMDRYYNGGGTTEWMQQALDRADVAGVNKALRDVSKKYGWSYTRKKTS